MLTQTTLWQQWNHHPRRLRRWRPLQPHEVEVQATEEDEAGEAAEEDVVDPHPQPPTPKVNLQLNPQPIRAPDMRQQKEVMKNCAKFTSGGGKTDLIVQPPGSAQ